MKAKGRYIRHQVSRLPRCLCHQCLPTVVAVLRIIGNPHLSFSDLCRSSSLLMKPITQSSFMASHKQKPEKQCHISVACAPHVAETSGENSKRRFMFLTRSSLFCYTRHSDSFSIRQSAKPWSPLAKQRATCFHAIVAVFMRLQGSSRAPRTMEKVELADEGQGRQLFCEEARLAQI